MGCTCEFCDRGLHTVGMSVSRLAEEISPKDSKGDVIPETAVTVSRLSRLLAEQVSFGTLGTSERRYGIVNPASDCRNTSGSPKLAGKCWELIW